MRKEFEEYYQKSDEQLKRLWAEAIFIFDTNVLLHLYRYSKETSKNFLETIEKFKENIVMPFQVGHEFHKNRREAIEDEIKIQKEFLKKIDVIYSEIENKNRNPFLSEDLIKDLASVKVKIGQEINAKIKDYESKYNDDLVLDFLTRIFEGKVTKKFSPEKLSQIYKEGETRYKDNIPPGFSDKKKLGNDKYGDLIIWWQIIEVAIEKKQPIVFITDDKKEDWWLIQEGKTISPRPELLKEFKTKTTFDCHFYQPFQFLKYSNQFLGGNIKSEVIHEVKNLIISDSSIDNVTLVLTIKSINSNEEDLSSFLEMIKKNGYKSSIGGNTNNQFIVNIDLPNIPDLERRFKDKFLSVAQLYNLEIIEYAKL